MSTLKKQFNLHYRKHKHTPEKVEAALLFDIQNYIPLYSRFFDLNDANYNQLQLNQRYYIQNINDSVSQYMPSMPDGGSGIGSGEEVLFLYLSPKSYKTAHFDNTINS